MRPTDQSIPAKRYLLAGFVVGALIVAAIGWGFLLLR